MNLYTYSLEILCSKAGKAEIKENLLSAWVLDNLPDNIENIAFTIDTLKAAQNLHNLKVCGLITALEVVRNHLYCSIENTLEPDRKLIEEAITAINRNKDKVTAKWFSNYLRKAQHVWPNLCKKALKNK